MEGLGFLDKKDRRVPSKLGRLPKEACLPSYVPDGIPRGLGTTPWFPLNPTRARSNALK